MSLTKLSAPSLNPFDEFAATIERRLASSPSKLVRDYTPYGALAPLFGATDPEICVVGAANTGKSRACLELLHRDALAYPGSRQMIARATRKSVTQSAMVTFQQKVLPPGVFGSAQTNKPIRFHSERQEYQYPNGSIIAVAGLDDPGSIFSSEWDRIYIQEASEVGLNEYEYLWRGIRNKMMPVQQLLSDMNPTHELFWLHERCDEGICREIISTHADNPTFTAEDLANLERMSGVRRERMLLGKRVADVEGSYYAKLLYEARNGGRIGPIPIDPRLPVHTSWDLGVADFTTIWFWQVSGRQRWAVDYYEMSGEGMAHYAQVCQRKAQRFGYTYGTFYLPHDAKARVQAMHAETREEMLRKLLPGIRMVVVPRVNDLADKIEASRALIPLTWFDNSRAPVDDPEARNTATGMQHLIAYKREYNESLGTFSAQPKHDKASHAASAFGEFAIGFKSPAMKSEHKAAEVPWYAR